MSRRRGLPFPSTSGEDPMTGVENNSYSHLAGATRPSDSPRLHSLSKPYSRPSSYAGRPNPAHPLGLGGVDGGMDFLQNYNGVGFNGIGGGFGNDRKSPQRSRSPKRPIQTTRPGMVKSNSSASLTRSGSESSLFSLAKNLLSKPLHWLATPSKPIPSRKNRERFDADL
ncbi:hypothetical protein TREMEDRAFT_56757, partial [Tremella mesenterica DSM 1558]|uniref:uncharacterized protein n=1 Tax=Tremella mesenterica (strain ATCC 24925 / CBS 8224 / DSM 1558 / NBRC 9311 / NRRL Y-6157 / RJB 2259-6 / UBC 559-6) TaxID=578456 RepID=UPI0003F4906A